MESNQMSGNQHSDINNPVFSTIEEAIEDIKNGKLVIVVDDEDRENEGDFITAARNATPEVINFMSKHGRGLVCVPLVEERCDQLGLSLMVDENTSIHETPFTISVDLKGHGCTTGISAQDRSKTVLALLDPDIKLSDFGKPGHIFPLRARTGGVLRRAGHTEAAIDLARLAGFEAAGVLVEILNDDGTMARVPQLAEIAREYGMKFITVKSLIEYRMLQESLIERLIEVDMPTEWGHFVMRAYRQTTTGEIHLALIKGEWEENEPVLARVHSSCATGDIFGSCRCDCGKQLHDAMTMVEREGKGVVLYMKQEGRGIGLLNKLRAYKLQEQGQDTIEANLNLGLPSDSRDYGVGAQILRDLGITHLRLITNNPAKRSAIQGYGLEIVEKVPLITPVNKHNRQYMHTKRDKMGHELGELGD
jgi:3,4-dihydroxy 2-butanone 4-phosphate synthase/GTP cyclohydrolase II